MLKNDHPTTRTMNESIRLLKVEEAFSPEGELIGLRITPAQGNAVLQFANWPGNRDFRLGDRFTAMPGESVTYKTVYEKEIHA